MLRILLVGLLAAEGVAAQQPVVPPAGLIAPAVAGVATWTAISGQARDLAIGGDGAVFAVDEQGMVWLRRPGASDSWVKLPGRFQRIAAVSGKQAWALGDKGAVYAYNGTWWRPMGDRFPIEAVDIGVSINNSVFAVTASGRLVALDARRGPVEVPGAPERLVRVSVDDSDRPWAVDRDGRVHHFDGRRWVTLDNQRVRDIDVGNAGVWLIGEDDALISLAQDSPQRQIFARAAVVASAPGGQPWVATADGRIYAQNPNTGGKRRTIHVEREQVFTELLNWQRVRGSARQIAISSNGAVLALGREGEVWQWRSRNDWGLLPGHFERIALDSQNTPWGVAKDGGRIMRYQGSYWEDIPGRARDIAAAADGSIWIVRTDGVPAQWQPRKRTWQAVAPVPKAAIRRLAVADDGGLWGVNKAGAVERFDGKQWGTLPGPEAVDIAVGPEGSVFMVGTDKRLRRWDAAGKRWERLNGDAAGVAVGPRGKPWIVTTEATILASAFFDELPDSQVKTVSAAAAQAAAVVAKMGIGQPAAMPGGVVGLPGMAGAAQGRFDEPLLYRKVAGTARDIAIGAEGSVFVVTFDGGLARWSNARNSFLSFPGQFSRIAVAPDGKPWGVTSRGEVFRHNGTDWRLVRNISAQDIAVGYEGTVIVSGPQDVLHKYDPAADAFVRLPAIGDNPPPAGIKVAVDPTGTPWVIGRDSFVSRCGGICERLPIKARSIDIGPEGSIVIVDTDRVLKRWNARTEAFERIDGIVDLVDLAAVGPLGKPWLLSTSSEVWASEFFRRDESRDITTAAVTAAVIAQAPASSSPPAFTFTLSMAFDKIALPGMFLYNPWPTVRMAIGVTGNLIAIDSSYLFWNYDEATQRLVQDVTVPSLNSVLGGDSIRSFVVGKDGTYWISNYSAPSKVYRRQGGGWVAVPGPTDCQGCTDPLPVSLAVGPDGTVYATSEAGYFYRYDATLLRFVRFTMPPPPGRAVHLSIDPSGRFWVASPEQTFDVGLYEYQGTAWVARHDAITGSLGWCWDEGGGCLSIGANGSVYGFSDPQGKLIRWNPSLRSWEVISTSPNPTAGGDYVIAPDGRPWVFQQLMTGSGPGLYRAR